jgi:ribosome-associated protein
MDIRKISAFADYFVLCNAETKRQMDAVAEEIDKQLTQDGARLIHREGNNESGWILLDFGAIIVHIFTPEQREFYQLDKLWSKAQVVVRIQ